MGLKVQPQLRSRLPQFISGTAYWVLAETTPVPFVHKIKFCKKPSGTSKMQGILSVAGIHPGHSWGAYIALPQTLAGGEGMVENPTRAPCSWPALGFGPLGRTVDPPVHFSQFAPCWMDKWIWQTRDISEVHDQYRLLRQPTLPLTLCTTSVSASSSVHDRLLLPVNITCQICQWQGHVRIGGLNPHLPVGQPIGFV